MNIEMAKRLVDRRRAAGLSQEGLATELGVSRQAVSKWERSESSPDTDNLIALAQLYGVSLDDLLFQDMAEEQDGLAGGEGPKAPEEGEAPAAMASSEAEAAAGDEAAASAEVAGEAAARAGKADEAAAGAMAEEAPIAVEAEALAEWPASRHGGGCSQGAGGHDAAAAGGPCAGESGRDYVHVSWRHGVHVKDADSGDEVHVGWDGVHVNDRSYHGWPEAHGDWRPQGWGHGAARGPGVPDAPTSRAWRNWNLFPYPLLVVAGYLWLGFGSSEWLAGLMLFATIPVYYALGGLLWGKRACAFFSTLYAMAVVAWFIEMCVMGHPHPAWVAFLTIPLVTWLLNALSHWWQGRKASDRHGA